jgi:tripeptide aminopeptidase
MEAVNLRFEPLRYHGGSDANVLNERGFTAIDLGIGAKNPHSNNEYILLTDMEHMVHMIHHMLTQSKF